MRISAALFAGSVLLSVPAFAAADRSAQSDRPTSTTGCARQTVYDAQKGGERGHLIPRKLTELPPATTYMAVWRHIGGCVAPLTMADYRKQPPR